MKPVPKDMLQTVISPVPGTMTGIKMRHTGIKKALSKLFYAHFSLTVCRNIF